MIHPYISLQSALFKEINYQNIRIFDFQLWQLGAPTCCQMASFSSDTQRRNSVRIYCPDGRQVNFSQSIFSCMKRFNTRCLQISASSLREAFGKVLLVFTNCSFHHETSFIPISFNPFALQNDSTTLCLVSLYFLLIISSICLNSSSICFMIILYQSSSTFLFFLIQTSTCFILSSSYSKVLRFSSLSREMFGIEFLLGRTRCSLCAALPQIQLTHSNLNQFQQYRVMKLLWRRHF